MPFLIYPLFIIEILLSLYLIFLSFSWRRVKRVAIQEPMVGEMYGGQKDEVDRLLALDPDQKTKN